MRKHMIMKTQKKSICQLVWMVGAWFACTSVFADTQRMGNTFIPADDAHIVYMGRISHRIPKAVTFTYPGVSIFANFEGTSLRMKAKPGSGDFMVEIDNQLPYRIGFTKNDSVLTLAEGLPEGVHRARIMYILEGFEMKPVFEGFYVDKGCELAEAPILPERRIEFIGNSITCGYGVESDNQNEHFTYDTENHFYTYAALTARALKAQHLVVARSGIGIYRNVGEPVSGSENCLPAMYGQVMFTDPTELWDHSLYTPDVVCVNLGTNDAGDGKSDFRLLTDGYRKFVSHLRDIYPKAKIVLLSGSMLNGKSLEDVKRAMDTVVAERKQEGDTEVYRFDMSPQTGSLGYGADWHPSMRQQQKMANELTAYLKTLMDW